MSELADFLLARIHDDEVSEWAVLCMEWVPGGIPTLEQEKRIRATIVGGNIERRAIIRRAKVGMADPLVPALLRKWALPYADHPDYREEWGSMTQPKIRCGNGRHPDGPWHQATPLPASWQYAERFRQWRRNRRYGCGCAPS